MLGAVELLKQNLTTDPDLRNFTRFTLDTVSELGCNTFAASLSMLDLIEKLHDAGVGTGRPMPVSLSLQGHQLFVLSGRQERTLIATLDALPGRKKIADLCAHLQKSTSAVDPDILLQRNAEMERHFNDARARAEEEMATLQLALKKRQHELQEVVQQAETDSLTGLFNRRAFDEKVKQAFLHTQRQRNSPLSLLYFDLDHFKKINDEFGHQVGDAHLVKMAGILRSIFREDVDLAFRFGGDEFAVVLYADYPLACERARQVLNAMENRVSIGIATINQQTQDNLTLEEFNRQADSALYEAKRRGRGQTVSHYCISRKENQCQFPCTEGQQTAGMLA